MFIMVRQRLEITRSETHLFNPKERSQVIVHTKHMWYTPLYDILYETKHFITRGLFGFGYYKTKYKYDVICLLK